MTLEGEQTVGEIRVFAEWWEAEKLMVPIENKEGDWEEGLRYMSWNATVVIKSAK